MREDEGLWVGLAQSHAVDIAGEDAGGGSGAEDGEDLVAQADELEV